MINYDERKGRATVEAYGRIKRHAMRLRLIDESWGEDVIEGLVCHYDPSHDKFQCQGWVAGLKLMCWVDGL